MTAVIPGCLRSDSAPVPSGLAMIAIDRQRRPSSRSKCIPLMESFLIAISLSFFGCAPIDFEINARATESSARRESVLTAIRNPQSNLNPSDPESPAGIPTGSHRSSNWICCLVYLGSLSPRRPHFRFACSQFISYYDVSAAGHPPASSAATSALLAAAPSDSCNLVALLLCI